jgi:beta-glucosidase
VNYTFCAFKITDKPTEELKAFGKTNLLQPGESQTITLTLNQRSFICYQQNAWIAEAGNYKVAIFFLNIKKTALFSLANIKIVEKQIQHLLRFEVY